MNGPPIAFAHRRYSITWVPGEDLMRGSCYCGAQRIGEAPTELWEWLLGHPVGHDQTPEPPADDEPRSSLWREPVLLGGPTGREG